MNPTRFLRLLAALPLALIFAACSPKEAPKPAEPAPAKFAEVAPAAADGIRVITITVADTMKYDVTHIDAKPGEKLKLKLVSTGALPKETMAHNWVLLKKDVDVGQFAQDAAPAKATGFIAENQAANVIAHTKLIGGGESDTVEFTAPEAAGEYDYLCSFPGHYLIGMRGILEVK